MAGSRDRDDAVRAGGAGYIEEVDDMEMIRCPECRAPADVVERFVLDSTDGPIEFARTLPVTPLVHRADHRPAQRDHAGGDGGDAMDVVTLDSVTLTHRDRAILGAVGAGTRELLVGVEPDLYVDGRCCCDQPAARRLAHAGLIAAGAGRTGRRVPARLTAVGDRVLARALVGAAATPTSSPTAESGTDCDLDPTTPSTGPLPAGQSVSA